MVAMSRRLIHYDAARHELEVAATVDEVKEIHDQSEALRTYGRQIHDAELEAWSAEIKLRARARIGELSEGLERTDEATRLIGPAKHGKSCRPKGSMLGSDSISMKFSDGLRLSSERNQCHANQFSGFVSHSHRPDRRQRHAGR